VLTWGVDLPKIVVVLHPVTQVLAPKLHCRFTQLGFQAQALQKSPFGDLLWNKWLSLRQIWSPKYKFFKRHCAALDEVHVNTVPLTMICLPQIFWKVLRVVVFWLIHFWPGNWKLCLSYTYMYVHAFVSVHQPGNDVSQRINRARHFMRAASSCLNRTEVIQPLMTILCLYYEMVHKCYSVIIHTGTCTCIGCNIECKHFC